MLSGDSPRTTAIIGPRGVELLTRAHHAAPEPDRACLPRSLRLGERPLAEALAATADVEARLADLRDSPAIPEQPDWVDRMASEEKPPRLPD